ncbi:phiSA1p31-related protein [Streptomyces sp. NPDC002386]
MTTDPFAHVRLVDFTETPLVLLIDRDGNATLFGEESFCAIRTAAVLQVIARDLLAAHPLGRCRPVAEPTVWERPAEPLIPQAGTLDRERRVWTDGTGHAWDLAAVWGDVDDREWRWHGSLDGQGAPLMRSADGREVEPLDVVRALYGPIAPVAGGAA